jgi:uncharacterized protein
MPDNKTVVRQFLAALGRGDVERLKTLMTDDIQAIATGTGMLSGTRSLADICSAAGMLGQVTRSGIDFRVLTLTGEEDRVAAEVEGLSTLVNGAPYNNQYFFLFSIRNGRIYRMKEYMDTKLVDDVLGPLTAQAAK